MLVALMLVFTPILCYWRISGARRNDKSWITSFGVLDMILYSYFIGPTGFIGDCLCLLSGHGECRSYISDGVSTCWRKVTFQQ